MLVHVQRHHRPFDCPVRRDPHLHLRSRGHPLQLLALRSGRRRCQVAEHPRFGAVVPEGADGLRGSIGEGHGQTSEIGRVAEQREANLLQALVPILGWNAHDGLLVVLGGQTVGAEPERKGVVEWGTLCFSWSVVGSGDGEGDLEVAGRHRLLAPKESVPIWHRWHDLQAVPQRDAAGAGEPVPKGVVVAQRSLERVVRQPPTGFPGALPRRGGDAAERRQRASREQRECGGGGGTSPTGGPLHVPPPRHGAGAALTADRARRCLLSAPPRRRATPKSLGR
mmetsp:Transcript_91727/g.296765  ORF Transcript_91727/g.296765 Transcript_91727/m.296765 type:complete len:281 (+) Transcript_91727:1147-1989(+)